ncbi:hypothetical protein ES708_04784 [subsurface metagenome]
MGLFYVEGAEPSQKPLNLEFTTHIGSTPLRCALNADVGSPLRGHDLTGTYETCGFLGYLLSFISRLQLAGK